MRFLLAERGTVFSTRERGARMLAELEETLADVDDLIVDLRGVRSLSYSFADEFIGPLVSRGRTDEHLTVRIANANGLALMAIKKSLRHRIDNLDEVLSA